MPAPSRGQVADAGMVAQRESRVRSIRRRVLREAEHAGGVEVWPRMVVMPTDRLASSRAVQDRIVEGRLGSRIERGVGVEDLQAAHQQDGEADPR